MRHHSPLPSLNKVHSTPIHSLGLRPRRHRDHQLLSVRSVPIGAFPGLPAPRAKVLAAAQRTEIAPTGIANQHHVPPVPTVTAIRPSARHMRLAPEAHAAIAASPALNPDFRLVVHRRRAA
jgi:hypothetical protein